MLRFLYLFGVDKRYSQNDIYEKLDALYSKIQLKKLYIGTITGSLYTKKFPKEVGHWEKVAFETEEFIIPTQYDTYLENYMEMII